MREFQVYGYTKDTEDDTGNNGRTHFQKWSGFQDEHDTWWDTDDAGDECRDVSSYDQSLADMYEEVYGKSHQAAEPYAVYYWAVGKAGKEADDYQKNQFLIDSQGKCTC